MSRLVRLSGSFLLFAFILSAGVGVAAEKPTPVKVLPNGLVVIVKENHAAPVCSARVFVHTGAMLEGKYLGYGVSHLLEHIVAGGTTKYRVNTQYDKIIDELGGNHNASTSTDVTQYYIDTTGENVYKAIDVLSEWTLGCAVSWPDWYREMGVVNREIERGEDSPDRTIHEAADQSMFKVHPSRVPVIGYKHLFNKLTYQDVVDYYNERYVPNNMIVSVVGDFDAAKVADYIEKAFSKKEAKPIPQFELPAEPEQVAPRVLVMEKDGVEGARMRLDFRTVSMTNPDMYPLDLASYILSEGDSSRFIRLIRDKGLAESVRSFSGTPSWDAGDFGVYAQLKPENIEAAKAAILEEVYRLKTELVTDEELQRAKTQKLSEHAFGRQTVEAQAEELGSSYLSTYDPDFDSHYTENIQKVTAEQIRDAAKKYFLPEKLCTALLVPKGMGAIAAEKPAAVETTPVKRIRLANGVTLLVKRNSASPIVDILACFSGGLRGENSRNNGVSMLMAGLLPRGTTSRSADDIAKAFDGMGGSLGASSGSNSIIVSAGVLKQDVAKGMEIFADVVMHPSFPPDEVEKLKNRTVFFIKRSQDDPMAEASRFFRQNMYLNSPYGMMPQGTVTSVAGLTREDLVQFHSRYVHPKNMVLAIFGDVEPAEAEQLAMKYFGEFRGEGPFTPPRPTLEGPLSASRTVVKINKKEGAVVYIGAPGVQMTDFDDRAVITVMGTVMGGYGYPGGWLHADLRGRQLVYEVHCFNIPGVEPGYFAAYARCQPSNARTVAEAILWQVYRMAYIGPTQEELDLAKMRIITTNRLNDQTSASQASAAAMDELYGLGYDYEDKFLARVKAVTLEDIRNVTRRYFKNYVLTVTTPDESIVAGVSPKPVVVK